MKNKLFFSMKLRMSISFSLVAVILVSLFGFLNYLRERENLLAHEINTLSLTSEINSERIDAWLKKRITAIESRKTMIITGGLLDLIKKGGHANNLYLKGNSEEIGVEDFYIGTPDKEFYYSGDWLAPPDFDPTMRPWYPIAVANNGISNTDYYVDENTGNLNMTFATPLIDQNNELLGVLGIDLFLNEIVDLVNKTQIEGVSAALIDGSGVTVAHPVDSLIGVNMMDLKDDDGQTFMSPVSESDRGHFEYSFQGEKKVLVFHNIESLGWKILLFAPEHVIFKPLKDLLKEIIIFIILTLVIFIVIVSFISNIIVKRIKTISLSLRDISEGEGDLTRTIALKSNDELTQLTVNFNDFVRLMKTMISNIKSSADSTLNAKNSLVANTEETAAAIAQISANMNSMEMQIKRLDGSISNSAQSVESIGNSVLGFNQIREEQAAIVEETAASIAQMISSLEQVASISLEKKEVASNLTDISRKGGDQLENLSQEFNQNVVTKLSDIEDMTNIIRGIASQINLLSMNAAIEAAHAGDSGKGFAVVADEIRKLAESSSNSVKTIDSVIKEIRKGVDDTVDNTREAAEIFKVMDSTVDDFVQALNQIANNTNELMSGSKEIGQTAERLNEITVNIKDSSDSMKKGTEELSNEMVNIEDVSRTVLGGIQEAVVGAGEIVTSMDQVTSLSTDLTNNSEQLKREIDRFKTES